MILVSMLGLGVLVVLSFHIVKWSIEVKYLEEPKFNLVFIYWGVMFFTLFFSVGLGLNVTKGYTIGNPIRSGNAITTLAMMLYAATSVSIWNSLYSWVAPTFAKIDYIKLKTLYRRFSNQIFILKKNNINYTNLEDLNNFLLNLIKSITFEVDTNLLFEDKEFQKKQLLELKQDLEILDSFFIARKGDLQYSDICFLAKEQRGGKVSDTEIQSLKNILSKKI